MTARLCNFTVIGHRFFPFGQPFRRCLCDWLCFSGFGHIQRSGFRKWAIFVPHSGQYLVLTVRAAFRTCIGGFRCAFRPLRSYYTYAPDA